MYNTPAMTHNPFGATPSINIVKLLIVRTGTFNPVPVRPYRVSMDGYAADVVSNRVASEQRGALTPTLMAGVANSILSPTATPQGVVQIPNQWQTERSQFVLEVLVRPNTMGTEYTYRFQGFTNYLVDPTPGGHIDPNVEFYINSYVRTVMAPTATGMQRRIVESAQIVNGQIISSQGSTNVIAQRPMDVYGAIQDNFYKASSTAFGDVPVTIDTRGVVGNASFSNSRTNNTPAGYLARVVDAQNTANTVASFGNASDLNSSARQHVYEASPSENLFIRALSHATGVPGKTSFNWPLLLNMDGTVSERTTLLRLSQAVELPTAGRHEYLDGSSREVVSATTVAHGIVSMMSEYGIAELAFNVNNFSIGGQPVVMFTKITDMSGADNRQVMDVIRNRIVSEIFFDLTYGNSDSFNCTVNANTTASTYVEIGFNDRASMPTPFTFPTLCDSLFAPIYSTDANLVNQNVHNLEGLLSHVTQAISPRAPITNI